MAQTKFHGKQVVTTPVTGEVPVFQADGTMESGSAGVLNAAGSDTEIQYNDNGVFGAEAAFTYDNATNLLTVPLLDVGTNITAGAAVTATTNVTASVSITAGLDYRLITTTANSGGGLKRLFSEVVSPTLSGATTVIQVNIPIGARLLLVQLRVDTVITGATFWDAAYSGGSVVIIAVGGALAKNTKINQMFDSNAATDITAGAETDITITAVGSPFTGGVIRAIVYYEELITMANNP